MDSTYLFLSVIFGAVSMGYITYGKKQQKGVAFLVGVGLLAIPYLGLGNLWLGVVGVVLMALPFFVRL